MSGTVSRSLSRVRRSLAGASLGALVAAGGAAHAQAAGDQSAATATAQGDPGTGSPDEIVVTATRRQENVKDVPIAVTAISGDKLDTLNSSGLDIRFLSSRTPSLQIESSFGRTFPRFYIRGLGNTDFDQNAAQPVSVVYDDVALESPLLKSFPVFDLAAVEVLRGPQGTLFGRNTPAGVVKLDSARPSDTAGGYASVEYGTYNTVNAEAAVGGPFGDGLSFRLSGLLQRRDDWVRNTDTASTVASRNFEGYRDLAGRFQLAYASGDFHALINAHARDLDGTPRLFRAGLFQAGSNHFSPGFDPERVALDGYTSQHLSQWGTNLHLDYTFAGIGTLYSVTSYERARVESTGDIDGGDVYLFPPAGLNQALFPDNTGGVTKPREFSQEVRFASERFGGVRFQGGVYYFHQKLGYNEFDYAYPYTTRAANLDQDIDHRDINENYGVFFSGDYKTGPLTLSAGVRYSHDRKHDTVSGYSSGLSAVYVTDAVTAQGYPILAPQTTRVRGSDVTWDASATYALSSRVNLYARGATGYLGPAIQDRVTFGSFQNSAPKETTISGEGGIKGESADHRLTFAVDGYWYRTKHFQLTAVGGATNSARLLTADHVIGYGAELELGAKPLPNVTLTSGVSYNFTKIHDRSLAVAVCGALCTPTDPLSADGNALVNGNRLPQAPRFVANATFRYDVPLANGDRIFFYTDWAYRSSINYFLYEAKEFRGRPLTEGGLKLGYEHRKLEVAVYVRNVLDQIRSISAIDFNNLTGMINDPRIVAGEVRIRF